MVHHRAPSGRLRKLFFGVSAGLSLTMAPRLASAGDATLAEALFREGRDLMRAGDVTSACPKLAESYREDPATGTLLALAMCHEKAGRLASAWTTYNAVVARAGSEGQLDREKAARRRAAALEARLSKLTLEVPADLARLPGFTLSRDGEPVPAAAWGSPVPIDTGEHTIEATAEGRTRFERKLVVGAGAEQRTLRVELGVEQSAAPLPPAAVAVRAEPARSEVVAPHPVTTQLVPRQVDAPPGSGSPVRTVGLALGITGLGVLAGGIAFGTRALVLDAESREDGHCDEKTGCDEEGARLNERAQDSASLANVLYATGGVLAATGIALYFVGAPRRSTSAVALQISPATAGASFALRVRGGF